MNTEARPSGSSKARDTLEYLQTRIASGQWPVNTCIPKEPELMTLIGVGKSTVREAVRSLASVGMLETVRGVGTFVRSRTPASSMLNDYVLGYSADELLGYRRALEVEAARAAAERRTPEQVEAMRLSVAQDRAKHDGPLTRERGVTPGPFHHLVLEAAGNPLVAAMYTVVMSAVRRAQSEGRIVDGLGHGERQADHVEVLEAIVAGDAAAAAEAMAQHVDRDLRASTDSGALSEPRPDPAAAPAAAQ